ncbi:MAG: hypothetical protein GYB31_15710 [Bacteroidetes bacterium]|nr:hypothetical protein [Bacteroidota bacterium]
MLENWLTPVNDPELIQLTEDKPNRLGAFLLNNAENPEKIRLALIGSDGPSLKPIRKALYKLSVHVPGLGVADLGNLRKSEPDFAIQFIREIQSSRIIPIFLAPDPAFLQSIFRGQAQKQLKLSLLGESPGFEIIDGKARGPLEKIINDKDLKHFSLLGGQGHFMDNATRNWMQSRLFEQLRLGELRGHIQSAEPLIRDADLVAVQLNLLKQIEAPAQRPSSPSGLFSEEACQLMRYAGMSDKIRSIGFFGFNPEYDDQGQSASVMAQLIWYFIEGIDLRKGDFPASRKNLVEYIVQPKDWHVPLTFWKSNKSGRWWLQVPEQKRLGDRHHLVPCSYENYLSCTNNEIPDRLVRILRQFE